MSYAKALRVFLEGQRAEQVPFDIAWANAMRRVPAPDDWGKDGTDKRNSQTDESPLAFARKAFFRAYHGQAMSCPDLGILTEDTVPVTQLAPEATAPPKKRCGWAEGCTRLAKHGRFQGFCKRHAEQLAALRDDEEGSAWNRKKIAGARAAVAG